MALTASRLTRRHIRAMLWDWAHAVERGGVVGQFGSPLARIVDEGPVAAAIRSPPGPTIPLMPLSPAYWSVSRALADVPAMALVVALVEFGVGQPGCRLADIDARAKRASMTLAVYRGWLRRIYQAVETECARA